MLTRVLGALGLTLCSCAPHTATGPGAHPQRVVPPVGTILYSSPDPRYVMAFSPDGARSGPLLDFRPANRPEQIRSSEPSRGVRCISVGPATDPTDYAIRRPLRAGDSFECGSARFRVSRCVAECRAAVIQVEHQLGNGRTLPSSMFVDSCLGVLAFSHEADMVNGIPFEAMMLLGDVGLLADPNYPRCRD